MPRWLPWPRHKRRNMFVETPRERFVFVKSEQLATGVKNPSTFIRLFEKRTPVRGEPANCWRWDDFTDNSNNVMRPPFAKFKRSHLLFEEVLCSSIYVFTVTQWHALIVIVNQRYLKLWKAFGRTHAPLKYDRKVILLTLEFYVGRQSPLVDFPHRFAVVYRRLIGFICLKTQQFLGIARDIQARTWRGCTRKSVERNQMKKADNIFREILREKYENWGQEVRIKVKMVSCCTGSLYLGKIPLYNFAQF